MTSMNWERYSRATGIGFVVLFIVAFIIYGSPPKVSDPTNEIVSFYDGDRGRVLTAMIIFGIAFLMLVWFIGTIANILREAGEGRLAATTIAMGAVFVGVQAVTGAIAGGLALNIASAGDAGVIQGLNTLVATADVISAYPLAGLIAAASIALWRSQIMASWYGYLGLLAAVLVVLHGTNWATSGFWAPTGGYVFVATIAGLGWTAITSGLLYVSAPVTEPVPERAMATPAS